jgi:signal transduction histidine kinase
MMKDIYKVLIIDDEEIVIDSCTEILANSDYQVATASNGMLGLDLMQEFQPDITFVDLKMPGLSGLEVLGKIQEYDPTIVSIVITGYATVSSAVEAMKQGAYDFLPKPFTPDELRLIAKRGVEKRKLVLETIALRREKEMLRENFAAIVSHELKSPLGAVQQNLFNLEYELSDKLSEDQKRRLERMKVRIADLLEMIRTWLRVYTTDLDAIKDNFKPLIVNNVISKTVESVQPHAMRKDIEIVTSIREPISQVNGEEGTLTEALINLSTNAIKYSHTGSEISIIAEEKEDNVAISIIDSGIGISDEDLPYIFNDFYRGKQKGVSESGVGVGLAITQRIIEAHNGSIAVKSKINEGSTFEIRLPVY